MHAESTERTLLEDWQARRQRLASGPVPVGQLGQLQIQILDYLIRRYGDSPQAARPARFSPKSHLRVNERAIVVHDHLWEGKVGGVKSRSEGETRVSGILKRMASSGEEGRERTPPEAAFDTGAVLPEGPILVGGWWELLAAIWLGYDQFAAADRFLRRNPFLTIELMRNVYRRLTNLRREDAWAADLLVRCENPNGATYAVLAWRERLAARHSDAVTDRLKELFCRPPSGDRVAQRIRAELANNNAVVRLEAVDILGEIGTLDDIGLLSDLLSLPPLDDEHPDERAALVRAMQQISGAG